jgi:MFS family permease
VYGAAGGIGLPLSGVIVDHFSWRWLFAVSAVVVLAALVAVVTLVPESPIKTPSRVDVPGAALLSLGLATFLVAISEGPNWGWSSPATLGLFIVAAVAFAIWVPVELRVPEPLVDLRIMAGRVVLFTNITAFLAGFSLFGAFVLVPQFVQTPTALGGYGFGSTATEAGLFLLPGSILGFISGPFAGRIGRRYGYRLPLTLGMGCASLGLVLLAEWHEEPWQVVVGMFIAGAGVPLSFAAMAKLVVDAVRPSETGIASGVNTVMRTIGGVVGGQIAATVLASRTIGGTAVPTEWGYSTAFWLAAVAAILAVCTSFAVTGRRRPALVRAVPEPLP